MGAAITKVITGPVINCRYITAMQSGSVYQPNFVERYSQTVINSFSAAVTIVPYLSPIILVSVYRRGLPCSSSCLFWTASLSFVYGLALLCRGFGRLLNPDYMKFVEAYRTFLQLPNLESRTVLRSYDYEFSHWPVDYSWKRREDKPWISLKPEENTVANFSLMQWPTGTLKSLVCYLSAHSFGRRMLYPGSVKLMQLLLSSPLQLGRKKLIEEYHGVRHKISTGNGLDIEVMLVDRRNQDAFVEKGNQLVIVCEGNAGFLEIGCMTTPLESGYSVLGWNHPGFGGSTGVPWPHNEESAIDAVVNFAFSKGFNEENIILFGWSIGGYSALAAAVNFPRIKGLFLDATFDDVLPLAYRTLPESIHSLVHDTIRKYMNLNIAEWFHLYTGPFRMVRRTNDEVIITEMGSPIAQTRSNRANFLLRQVLNRRYPHLLPQEHKEDVESTALNRLFWSFLEKDADERIALLNIFDVRSDKCADMFAKEIGLQLENTVVFPMQIGRDLPLTTRQQLLLHVLRTHFDDFASTHCTPLPVCKFDVPHSPWDYF